MLRHLPLLALVLPLGCAQQQVQAEFAEEPAGDGASASTVPEDPAPRPAVAAAPATKVEPASSRAGGKDRPVVSQSITLGDYGLLKLRAAADRDDAAVEVTLIRLESEPTLESCSLGVMLNGERIAMPKSRFARRDRLSALSSTISREFLPELGSAEQLALRACDHRWSLDRSQLAMLHGFVSRYQEELAWELDPKTGAAAMLAPSGGWPNWTNTGAIPAAHSGEALASEALFTLLSPSVFQVEALRPAATAQGSAVAVSATELLTNCHVIAGARKIIVKQKGKEWVASVVRADPNTDRCVLTVPDQAFVAVRGVRRFSDLKVGEPLYTLGSPSGLELSLSNGLLSGLRDEEGRQYVQTTAPISPGSSGGGLFDARGNLVGVTTLVLAGKRRLNQALNFAIPADTFFQP